eukprot:362866-Chlamydomonas_euryale.AAC.5
MTAKGPRHSFTHKLAIYYKTTEIAGRRNHQSSVHVSCGAYKYIVPATAQHSTKTPSNTW